MPRARDSFCQGCCTSFVKPFGVQDVCCGGQLNQIPAPRENPFGWSPLIHTRFKNTSGAGTAVVPVPVPPACCEGQLYQTLVKRYILAPEANRWNFSAGLLRNSALANRLKIVQKRNAIRANQRSFHGAVGCGCSR